MKNKLKILLKSNSFNKIRNLINYRPTISLKPINPRYSVSDFFYWSTCEGFDTKIMLTNFSTQTTPDTPQLDQIKIIIYNDKGSLLDEINYNLEPFQTIDFKFSNYFENKFGSFFVFHKLENMQTYIDQNSHLSERGYISYKRKDGIWSFMHGNLNSAYFDDRSKKPVSILTESLFSTNKYLPQVSFKNCESFAFIINNPMNKKIKIDVDFFNDQLKIVKTKKFKLEPLSTLRYFEDDKNINFFQLISKIIFLRPIIYKEFKTYFDIFHG